MLCQRLKQRLFAALPELKQQALGNRSGTVCHTVNHLTTTGVMHAQHVEPIHLTDNQIVAGADFINQSEIQRLATIPVFASRHFIDVERRTHLMNELLKQQMGFIQIFLKLFPSLIGVFAKQGQGPLILASGP